VELRTLRSIQVLRAVAACSVLVSHTYEPVHDAAYGAAGVDLFFVISGFIMANVTAERTADQFARDRLSRIYPLWWIAALPWLLLVPRGPLSIVSTLTLWPIYGNAHVLPVLKVGWTLCLEILFYAGMTLSMATRPGVALATYILCFVGALTTSVTLLHFVGSPMALEFLMGIAVARLPRRRILGLLIPVGLVVLPFTSTVLGDLESSLEPWRALQRTVEWGLPAALVVWGALSLEGLFAHRLFNAPVKVGNASYSIYLFHPLISYGFDIVWPARMALGLATGLSMYALVERKIMAARRTGKIAAQRAINIPTGLNFRIGAPFRHRQCRALPAPVQSPIDGPSPERGGSTLISSSISVEQEIPGSQTATRDRWDGGRASFQVRALPGAEPW
jgi:exopolysaccharide production protein ExoZ